MLEIIAARVSGLLRYLSKETRFDQSTRYKPAQGARKSTPDLQARFYFESKEFYIVSIQYIA